MPESKYYDLERSVEKYQKQIGIFDDFNAELSSSEVLQLLRARDVVEKQMIQCEVDDSQDACTKLLDIDEKINQLDNRLRDYGSDIAQALSLDYWRKRLAVPEDFWWWDFEAPKRISLWDRFDWLWDFITLVVLALSASYMFSIFKALSVGEFTIVETFSTIAQVGGLAVVSQGALTQTGRDKVNVLLRKLSIPSRYHSELLLVISLMLLALIYYSHQRLDQYYVKEGHSQYEQGMLAAAENSFTRALEINPNNFSLYTSLGEVYESTGELDKALINYSISAHSGELDGINNMGRTLINRVHPVLARPVPEVAEAFLLLGLKHVEVNQSTNPSDEQKDLHYQFARNAGWAVLMQKKYSVAETILQKAVALDKSIPGNQTGGGMAYCFLADTYDHLEKKQLANENWQLCMDKARPETIHEYKWLVIQKQGVFVNCVDTSRVITLNDMDVARKTYKSEEILNAEYNAVCQGKLKQTFSNSANKANDEVNVQVN